MKEVKLWSNVYQLACQLAGERQSASNNRTLWWQPEERRMLVYAKWQRGNVEGVVNEGSTPSASTRWKHLHGADLDFDFGPR
jgi:hypothetical protein